MDFGRCPLPGRASHSRPWQRLAPQRRAVLLGKRRIPRRGQRDAVREGRGQLLLIPHPAVASFRTRAGMHSAGFAAMLPAASGFAVVGLNSPSPVTIWILSLSDIAPSNSDVRSAGVCCAPIQGPQAAAALDDATLAPAITATTPASRLNRPRRIASSLGDLDGDGVFGSVQIAVKREPSRKAPDRSG